jgi:hypothetical protein
MTGKHSIIIDSLVYDSSEFDSTGVKLYIFIHNEVRDFDKNSTQPEIQHPVIEFDIFTLGYCTCLFHNLSN